MKSPLTILFFGSPGSGKSTYAEMIAGYIQRTCNSKVVPFFWSEFRDQFMRGNSSIQEKIRVLHAMGKLQPKFFSISIWGPKLLQEVADNDHIVIDGIPRQLFEAEALHSAFEFLERNQIIVFNMEIPNQVASTRIHNRALQEGRSDDITEESIQRRLSWYESDTKPVLDFFLKNSMYSVVTISSNRSSEDIYQELQKIIIERRPDLFTPRDTPSTEQSTIVVGIGMPGAGKTTLLKPLANRFGLMYLNRDETRREFFGNPLAREDKDRVQKKTDRRLKSAHTTGNNVMYDATFAEQDKRRDFIKDLRDMGWKRILGFYVDTPYEVAKERNRSREYVVSDDELEKCFIRPLQQQPPSVEDGFDELYTLKDLPLLEQLLSQ